MRGLSRFIDSTTLRIRTSGIRSAVVCVASSAIPATLTSWQVRCSRFSTGCSTDD
jgi:hypothetical protein